MLSPCLILSSRRKRSWKRIPMEKIKLQHPGKVKLSESRK
jgi:hypothetical protein